MEVRTSICEKQRYTWMYPHLCLLTVNAIQNQPYIQIRSLEKEKVQLYCPTWSVVDGRLTFSNVPATSTCHSVVPAVTLPEFFAEIVSYYFTRTLAIHLYQKLIPTTNVQIVKNL